MAEAVGESLRGMGVELQPAGDVLDGGWIVEQRGSDADALEAPMQEGVAGTSVHRLPHQRERRRARIGAGMQRVQIFGDLVAGALPR